MQLIKVNDKKSKKDFLEVARIIYKNNDIWVCPLDNEINPIFDSEINTYYKHGEAERWILKDDSNNLIGRIAAFIDFNTAHIQDQPTGGMGFFECINDKKVAHFLFDTAKKWLQEKGMQAMDGPINFGETDKYWGLLVDGFTHPSYEIAYNHEYYQELFESYGFKTYYKQEGFHLDLTKELPERFMKIAEWVSKKPEYKFEHLDWKEKEKFTIDFAKVFNEAWASFKENFEPLKAEYIRKTLQKAKAIIDEEFIWIAFKNEEPIAIYLMYPDINMILKKMNGNLNIWNKLKFLYFKKIKTITRARGVLMGVIPKYQGLGIEAAIILQLAKVFERKTHYKEIEFSWVGDFNPKMRKIFMSVGSKSVKHYITYRYLFDQNVEFKRYPIPEE
ncbi:MAG: GNAT family N-acetyltransferase [Bacteroidota bacterium]|nr:GNAT family N-acetyltransferase [Bacteroidota bacterium]